MRLIEPTSGNTGIALAMIAARAAIAIELVMPENATAERVDVDARVRRRGDPHAGREAAWRARSTTRARRSPRGGYLMLDQFANPDNWRAHYETTGPGDLARHRAGRSRIS